MQALAKLALCDEANFQSVIVSRDFDGKFFYEYPDYKNEDSYSNEDLRKSIESCASEIVKMQNIPADEKERYNEVLQALQQSVNNINETGDVIENLKTVIAGLTITKLPDEISSFIDKYLEMKKCLTEKVDELIRKNIHENNQVSDYINKNMPKYVYYSNYGNLDSEIYLPVVIQNMARNNLGEKEAAKARTLKTLFSFVKLDPDEIFRLGKESPNGQELTPDQIAETSKKKEEREILLSSAASSFTRDFNEWWKQGDYIFKFRADGDFFKIWVSDSVRPEEIELESRSSGLQWFFSFYLVFLVESEHDHKNAILLLDEPGLTLHPLAQKDLFNFFESLSQKNSILYTTHSPFMVDANHLERVRSVYMDQHGKTKVSSDLRASEATKGKSQTKSLYPVHAALGLTVSDTLLINCEPIIVEGESDQIYLSALKNLLISKQKIFPLKELVFIPSGGVKGIRTVAAIVSGREDILPYVLLDGDKPGKSTAEELKKTLYSECQNKIIDISKFTDIENGEIEDIFPVDKIANIISRSISRPEDVENDFIDVVKTNVPICDQVQAYAQKNGINLGIWKVKIALLAKKEILRGNDKLLSEKDPQFEKIIQLFKIFCASASAEK